MGVTTSCAFACNCSAQGFHASSSPGATDFTSQQGTKINWHLWEWGSKARKRGPGIPKSQGNYTLPHCLDSCRNFSLLMIPKLQFCNLITCSNLSREDMELMEKITKKITKKRQPTNFSYKKPGTVSHCWQWRPAKQVDLEGRILTPLIHGITVTILLYPTKNPKCILL